MHSVMVYLGYSKLYQVGWIIQYKKSTSTSCMDTCFNTFVFSQMVISSFRWTLVCSSSCPVLGWETRASTKWLRGHLSCGPFFQHIYCFRLPFKQENTSSVIQKINSYYVIVWNNTWEIHHLIPNLLQKSQVCSLPLLLPQFYR